MKRFTRSASPSVSRSSGRVVRKAFTLIELLVVISIIGLLMAILLPALQSAREQGQFTASISNIRQIQIGLLNYTGDSKDVLPWGRNPTSTQYWLGWPGKGGKKKRWEQAGPPPPAAAPGGATGNELLSEKHRV